MTKVVFTASDKSKYQDLMGRWYHFPNRYLAQAKSALGDFVVFYQPRRNEGPNSTGGSQSYTSMARVVGIRPDPKSADHHYADLAEYIKFDRPVPFQHKGNYFESALQKPDGTTNRGAFGWSVRPLPDAEFELIFRAGFERFLTDSSVCNIDMALSAWPDHLELPERLTITSEVTRKVRDIAFRAQVREAYQNTCAVTGWSILGPTGQIEVQAAHIRSVATNGPDVVNNGIALCGTVHWLFDQGLISIQDDLRVIVASCDLPKQISALIQMNQRLRLPIRADDAPHPSYLQWHREQVFIG